MIIGPKYANVAAPTLVALALSVLAGWHFDIAMLKTILPGLNSMKVNTAVALLLSGLSILTILHAAKWPGLRWVGLACATVVGLIGSLSAFEILTGTTIGIDELLYADTASYGTSVVPGQMSIITALVLCIASAGLFAGHSRSKGGDKFFVSLTTLGLILTFLLFLVFAYGAPIFFLKIRASSVAIHTVFGLILLFTALAATRPNAGFIGRLNSPLGGGRFVRRLTAAVVFGVPLLGWLRLHGELLGWYDGRVGLAIFASANVMLMIAVLWVGGYNADRADNRRLKDKVKQQQALAAFSAGALTAHTIGDLYKLAVNSACATMGAKFGSLVDIDEAADTMHGLNVFSATEIRPVMRTMSGYPSSSILHYVRTHKQPVWFNDKHEEKRFTFNDRIMAELRSGAVMPMISADGSLRLLNVFYDEPHEFTSDEIEFLQSLINTLVLAIERRKMADTLNTRMSRNDALVRLSEQALSFSTLSELSQAAISVAFTSMGADYGSLAELDQANDQTYVLSLAQGGEVYSGSRRYSSLPKESLFRYSMETNEPVWFTDIDKETRFKIATPVMQRYKSGLLVPVAGTDNRPRRLNVYFETPREFTLEDVVFLSSIATIVATAHARIVANDALQQRMKQTRALVEFSEKALTISTLKELSETALSTAFTCLGANYGSLAEYREGADEVTVLHLPPDRKIYSTLHKLSELQQTSAFYYAFKTKEPVWFSDILKEDRFTFSDPTMMKYRSGMIVPIISTDGQQRRLSVFFEQTHDFLRDEIDFLASVASIVATAHARILIADELKAQNIALEKADRTKSQFLAMMSHELRTPMAGLLGMADLLVLTGLNHEQQQMAQRLIRSGKALLDILNDILDFSKLDADKMELENVPFKLSDMLSDLRDLFTPIAAEKGLELAFALPVHYQDHVIGDAKRIRQVITNLINNAVKFTARGRVAVTLEQTPNADKSLATRISVSDTGIGIESDKLSILFKPFAQADASTSRKYGGTGLGLAICQKLVTLMGGEIAVSSKVGQGSTFAFTLTLAPDRTAAELPAQFVPLAPRKIETGAADAAAARALKILLAEDNETNRLLVTAMLEKKGHKVEGVENGKLAVDALTHGGFDVVLMDMQMPVMDGVEAMRLIRASEAVDDGPRLPIIALTADVVAEHAKGYLQAGADAIVAKPVNWPVLFAEIDRQVAKATL
jgi:signal transduction histidine kinase/CheY-like chemotaxis protein